MDKSIKSVIVLTAICLITALLLAVVNGVTAPIIDEAEKRAEYDALKVVFPEGDGFSPVDTGEGLPESVKKIYAESSGKGYVFRMTVSGYASGMNILCGISSDGSITGAVCLSSSETLGAEKTFGGAFKGLFKDDVSKVHTIAGATLTTEAYRSAVEDAFKAFEIISESKEDK